MFRNVRRKHPKLCRGLIDAARRKEAVARAHRAQGRRIPTFERLGANHSRRPARLRREPIGNHSALDVRVADAAPEATQAISIRPNLTTVFDSFSRMLIKPSVWIEEERVPSPDTPKGDAQISNSESGSDLMPIKRRR